MADINYLRQYCILVSCVANILNDAMLRTPLLKELANYCQLHVSAVELLGYLAHQSCIPEYVYVSSDTVNGRKQEQNNRLDHNQREESLFTFHRSFEISHRMQNMS
jgi:hypothetical protein